MPFVSTHRAFVSATALAATLSIAFMAATESVAQSAAATRTLSIATLAPSGSQMTQSLEAMNREVRRRTSGRLALRWYFGGVQGDEREVVRKIRSGRLDGGALSATGLQHMHRPVLAFQLPAMFSDAESFLRAYQALKPTLEEGFQREGFALAHLAPASGPRMFSARCAFRRTCAARGRGSGRTTRSCRRSTRRRAPRASRCPSPRC